MSGTSNFPPPPRLTGNAQNDMVAMTAWVTDFYRTAFGGAFATPQDLADAVDPTSATAATAQTTANSALSAATAAQAELDAMDAGQVTVSGAATTAAVTFATAQTDTSYYPVASAVDFSGAPGNDAFIVTKVTKTTSGFTLQVAAAPGVGNSVTFAWHVRR